MNNPTRFALAAACVFAAFSGSAEASEADFLKRFNGSFAGGGQFMDDGDAHKISCKMSGSATASTVNIGGNCNAGIVSKNVSASLRAGKNGRYTGSYNGGSLSGRRKGNTIVLSVRGAKPATMTISNSGGGISLSVVANEGQTTKVSLSRSGGSQVASLAE